ncbi:MDR family MFS transporter [Alicyclobacillus dauci]|uniref:MFS transporter n=1 Tax=Alicyclobacillus dauci TaxID=1475485 RepID=A0ABY6Z5E9_9BACL|nr:MFS transporter [Alicyclobacillus dauci]WAH37250.1 MFS transporter [Alicyclobacillus dauci]
MSFRSLHRNIKIRLFVGLLFGIAQSTTMPFMAIYFAKSVGEVLTGILLTVATLASLLSGALGGYYCDRYGRRRILIFGETVFLVSYAVMACANSPFWNSPWATFVTFLVGNMCFGAYAPADEAMLLDLTTPAERPAVYGMFYWLHNLTLAIGASLGAFLFEGHKLLLFSLTGAAVLVTLFTTVLFIQETLRPDKRKQHGVEPQHRSFVQVYGQVLKDRAFMMYLLGGILVATLEFQLNNYIGIHLAKAMVVNTVSFLHHAVVRVDGLKMIGILQTENTILVVLLATLAVRFVANRDKGRILLWGLIFNVSGFTLMTVLTTPVALVLAMFLATVGEVVNVPIRQAFLGDLAPDHMRSTYAAMNGMTFGAGRMLATMAVALGAVLPNWTMGAMSGIVGTVGILLVARVAARSHGRKVHDSGVAQPSGQALEIES